MLGLACLCLTLLSGVAPQCPRVNGDFGAAQTPARRADQKPSEAGEAAGEDPDQPAGGAQHKIQPVQPPTNKPEPVAEAERKQPGFHWKGALEQSLLMLAIQRGGDLLTEPDTRLNLRGPFFKDYFRSVANTRGWRDGDPTATNYLAHPFQGAVSGFIQVQNDPKGVTKKFGFSGSYWKSRLKAMGWAAAYSTYFEIGPGISEAMVGNVGLPARYKPPHSHPRPPNGGMGFVDMVVTPTVGTAWLVSEDVIDRYVISKLEKRTGNTFLQVSFRILLNPARTSANLLRVEKPWHRDSRGSATVGVLARGN
jgi:hypothetical protein